MDFAAGAAAGGFGLAIFGTALVFGLRHGIDWDHIAAITDITSSQESPRASMRFASLYAVGHALVVLVLGLVAIEIGGRLPAGVDSVMERIVGITLLVLGAYVFYALIRHGRDFRMRSRWMLVLSGIARAVRAVRRKTETVVVTHEHEHGHDEDLHRGHDHPPELTSGRLATATRTHRHAHTHVATMPADPFAEYGPSTSLLVGMIHGIGAETPTQVLLFLSAVGVGGRLGGALVLVTFLAGLLISNTAVAVASTYGFVNAARNFKVYATIAVLTGAFSLTVGTLFVLGRGTLLPALLGG